MKSQRTQINGDFCRQAQLLMRSYESVSPVELLVELNTMEKWLNSADTQPLLLQGQPNSGKKTLLCNFLKKTKELHSDWLQIVHFSSLTPYYAHILYQTTVLLRNHFSIEQRVELNQEKLRRYFKYWLEKVSEQLDRDFLGYKPQDVPKVLIVIEGIDRCCDSKGNHVEPAFWLPPSLPRNVKLVISTQNLTLPLTTVLHHPLSQSQQNKIVKQMLPGIQKFYAKNPQISLLQLQLINQMSAMRPQFQPLKQKFDEILQEYIEFISKQGLDIQLIKSILYLLTLTKKGIKYQWISRIVKLSQPAWNTFTQAFSFILVQAEGFYLIVSEEVRKTVTRVVDESGERARTYRREIARSIGNDKSWRALQESVVQWLISQSYIQLKQSVCRVQNFLMLYTPGGKGLLCQCWVKLQGLEQYDPVLEYNRALQSFVSHFFPKQQQLFRITFQLCMFFKQYAAFENSRTPAFRHPAIRGQTQHLQQIGIQEQLRILGMLGKSRQYKTQPLQKTIQMISTKPSHRPTRESGRRSQQCFEENSSRPSTQGKSGRQKSKQTEKKEQSDQQKNQHETQQLNVQQLNVTIGSHQEKFRQFFIGQMRQYLQQYFTPLKKNCHRESHWAEQWQDSDPEEDSCKERGERDLRFEVESVRSGLLLKDLREYLQESYHMTGEQVSNYYYKQWLWVQFPWISQTPRHNYSSTISQCIPDKLNFMSPKRQQAIILQGLKITNNAQQNKVKLGNTNIQVLALNNNSKPTKKKPQQLTNTTSKLDFTTTKLNLGSLDQQLSKEKAIQAKFREKYGGESKLLRQSSSHPNLGLFITESTHKDSQKLPVITKARMSHTKENNVQDSRDFTLLIRKYNQVKHENDMLVGRIQELKKLSMINVDRSKEDQERFLKKIQQLQIRKQQLERSYSSQLQLKKKLQVIIKVCDFNKMYGSQTDLLSAYLSNLRQMIAIEQTSTRKIKEGLQKQLQDKSHYIKELRSKKKTQKLHQQQLKSHIAVDISFPAIVQESDQQIPACQKTMPRHKSKKQKSRRQQFYNNHIFNVIQQDLGISYQHPENASKIDNFAYQVQKLKELSLKNAEIERQLKEKHNHNQMKEESGEETSRNERALKAGSHQIQLKHQLSRLQQRRVLLSNSIASLA